MQQPWNHKSCSLTIYSMQTYQVVGHFTVHGLSVSVSVNTGAGGIQANINTNNNVRSAFIIHLFRDNSPFKTVLKPIFPSEPSTQVIDAMTNFLQATMSANTGDVHDATINFVNAFMNADNNTTAAMNFLSAIAVS